MQPKQDQKNTASSDEPTRFILIGEDDADDEELLKEIFSSLGATFSLIFINNGQKLISVLDDMSKKNLPCLILLDYNMPEMNGSEILKHLSQNKDYRNIPKIIWSTSNSDTYRNLSLENGADDYILKPTNLKELTDVVRHLLSRCRV